MSSRWSESHDDWYRTGPRSDDTWNYPSSRNSNYASVEESTPRTVSQNPTGGGDGEEAEEWSYRPRDPGRQFSYYTSASRAVNDGVSGIGSYGPQAGYLATPQILQPYGKSATVGPEPVLSVAADEVSTVDGGQYMDMLRGTEGTFEKLDPDFKKVKDHWKFYIPGRVFKTIWWEPIGKQDLEQSQYSLSVVKYSEEACAKILQFIVVRAKPKEYYSNCLRISTYGGRGATWKGLNQNEHCIIYTGKSPPNKLEGESKMCKEPIYVKAISSLEKLDPLSRVNLTKTYPVEHKSKIKEIGMVSSSDLKRLIGYWRNSNDGGSYAGQLSEYLPEGTERKALQSPLPIMPSTDSKNVIGDIQEKGSTMHLGTSTGNRTLLRTLLEGGTKTDAQDDGGKTALHRAAQYGSESIVQLLLDNGADIRARDDRGNTALHCATENWNESIARLLLSQGADIEAENNDGRTALNSAAKYGFKWIVQLLDSGANIQARDNRSNTALHFAVQYGSESIVQLLLDNRADIQARDNRSNTALHFAVQYGSESIVQLLLDNGADIQARDNRGNTALHYATEESIALLLLSYGADIEAKDDEGMTPLHWAAKHHYIAIIRLLIENGADIEASDFQGRAALYWAARYKDTGILRLFFEKGVDMLQFICKEMQRGIETSQPRDVIFQLHWDLLGYCKEELEGNPVLAPLLTVTGSAKTAYATTCEEYMNRYWPKSGLEILQTLQTALGLEVYETCWSSGLRFTVDLSAYHKGLPDRHATIKLFGTQEQLTEIAQQLAWLSAVFRVPRYDELSLSAVVLERIDDESFKLFLLDLQPLSEKEFSCWHPLFVNGVIAHGFPIPERQEEVGIELPFEVMTALSRVLYPIEYYDGIILKGPFTALVPIAHYSDSVQWHFIGTNTGNERLATGSIGKHLTDWFETCDFDLLKEARTFLGYCRNAEIHLGTQDLDYSSIKRSDAQSERSRFGFTPKISFSVGSSGQGFFGAMFGSEVVYNKGLRATIKSTDLFLEDRLRRASEQPLLLYDTEKKRGWLVPELSVILHIVHVWAFWRHDLSPNTVHNIPHAVISANGGMAAYDAIDKGRLLKVLPEGIERKPQFFIDVIKSFLTALESLKEEIITREDSSSSRPFRQPGLRGWDILDIVTRRQMFRRKEIPIMKSTGGNWDLLASENPEMIVLFGEGLGEPIKPERHQRLCRTWTPVPEGKCYLTASIQCLEQLAAIHGGPPTCPKLTPRLYWHRPPEGKLFEACEFGVGRGCDRLQSLEEKRFTAPGALEPNGAVIFGKMGKEDSRCCEPLKRKPTEDADENAQHDLHPESRSLIGMPSNPDQVAILSYPTQNWGSISRLRTKQPTQEQKHDGEGKAVSIECLGHNGTEVVPVSLGEGNDIVANEHSVFPCSNGEGPPSVQQEHSKGRSDINEVHHKEGKKPTYLEIVPTWKTFDTISSTRKDGKKPLRVGREPISETSATALGSRKGGKRPEYATEEDTMENDDTSRTSYGNGNTHYSPGIGGTNYHFRDLEANVLCRRPGLKDLNTTAI